MRRPQLILAAGGCAALAGSAAVVVDSFVATPRRRAAPRRSPARSSFGPLSSSPHFLRHPGTARCLFDRRASWATKEDDEDGTTTAVAPSVAPEERRVHLQQPRGRVNGSNNAPTNGHAGGDGDGGIIMDVTKFLRRDDGVDEAWELSDMAAAAAESEGAMQPSGGAAAALGIGAVAIGAAALAALSLGVLGDFSVPSNADAVAAIERFFSNPSASLESVVNTVQSMGPSGLLYFGTIYTIAEVLAIPAIPLTASAGYLFGVQRGTAVVLVSASVAAAVSFLIGRTLLRAYVESVLDDYPKFRRIDRAIGREGFKLMLLLRLSPVFPFALSNYLYGATSIGFWPYFFGTMLGFAPGTVAYVYTGEIGKALTLDSAAAEPWYVYAGGLAVLGGFLKVVADVATGIIDNLDDDDEE